MDRIKSSSSMIERYPNSVTSFSSQYGGRNTSSYLASNLAGPCSNYPKYGDFIEAFVLRTYGPWWQKCPSAQPVIRGRPPDFLSQDFVEVSFGEKVYPRFLDIYETFNPGAIVRILAGEKTIADGNSKQIRWHTLWSGSPEQKDHRSRKFSPKLKRVNFPTKLLRLEFNSSNLYYYTELDGVILSGYSKDMFHPESKETDLDEILSEKISHLSLEQDSMKYNCDVDNGHFDKLPVEVLQKIFSYLDLYSLCKCASVCTLFRDNTYDPLQYTDLDLQPFWTQVNNDTLLSLTDRCQHLTRLNLAWTGQHLSLRSDAVSRFIRSCGSELGYLSLSCCPFVNRSLLDTITESSNRITSIDLSGCHHLKDSDFEPLSRLTLLESVNLCDTDVLDDTVCSLVRNNPNLKHLNIDSCRDIVEMETVTRYISENCLDFRSLNTWRNKNMNAAALSHLYLCKQLEEVDLGWCSHLSSSSQCLVKMAKKCVNLKKIFLTANRTVCDDDLKAFSENLPHLEQLDILGNSSVSADAMLCLLKSCTKLEFLDVSFCANITNINVHEWRINFPHVNIKKSFQGASE